MVFFSGGGGVGDVFSALESLSRRYGAAGASSSSSHGNPSNKKDSPQQQPLLVVCEEVFKTCCPLLKSKECQDALSQLQAAYARRLEIERSQGDETYEDELMMRVPSFVQSFRINQRCTAFFHSRFFFFFVAPFLFCFFFLRCSILQGAWGGVK